MSTIDLFTTIVDDAAMFPPGNADADTAVGEHLRYRTGPMDRFVGPLLVHADRWVDVAAAHAVRGSPAIDVVVLGTVAPPRDVPGIRVVGFELAVPALPLPPAPPGRSVACEVRPDAAGLDVVRAIGATPGGYLGKFRTGGTTAEAFPDETALARVVVAGAAAGASLKFTAGLHHAVRFRDDDTGFEHHGFLNLLVAARTASTGGDESAVADVLGTRDGKVLADEVRRWSDEEIAAVRGAFVSFGCCGVEDPVTDLVGLGLLELALDKETP